MEHWFDRLARPQSRRTALKAGALAGAALLLPRGLVSTASATRVEPCFRPCMKSAAETFNAQLTTGCPRAPIWVSAAAGNAVLTWLGVLADMHCQSSAELAFHRATRACEGSECGDPSKYPGGKPPRGATPICDPAQGVVLCGDGCCNQSDTCMVCPQRPSGFVCCAGTSNCCA